RGLRGCRGGGLARGGLARGGLLGAGGLRARLRRRALLLFVGGGRLGALRARACGRVGGCGHGSPFSGGGCLSPPGRFRTLVRPLSSPCACESTRGEG